VREPLGAVSIATRIDSALFNETITNTLHGAGVAFTISVPFERFTELKTMFEARKRWRTLDEAAVRRRGSLPSSRPVVRWTISQ
jgi:Na+/alanine symporter